MTSTTPSPTSTTPATTVARPVDWFEIVTPDAETAKAFYSAALGWDIDHMGGPIWTIEAADTRGNITEAPEATPTAIPVVQVDSLESTVDAVVAAGGSVMSEINEGPMVRWVHVADPAGARFGLWQPK